MSDFFDARTRFYLEHQEDIDRWASLRNDAAVAATSWLESLNGVVDELTLTLEPAPFQFPIRGSDGHGLALPGWPQDEDGPALGVALAWIRRDGLAGAYAAKVKPYVGVWIAPHQAEPPRLEAPLKAAGLTGRAWSSTPTAQWPAWRWVPVGERWWENLDVEADRLVDELGAVWTQASPVIDQVVKSS